MKTEIEKLKKDKMELRKIVDELIQLNLRAANITLNMISPVQKEKSKRIF